MEFPSSAAEKLLKRTGLRVSDEAVTEFTGLLEEIASDLAAEADANAKSLRRRTIKPDDIEAAKRALLG